MQTGALATNGRLSSDLTSTHCGSKTKPCSIFQVKSLLIFSKVYEQERTQLQHEVMQRNSLVINE